ncbi:hypothetical protein [Zymomonas mobilis]|nr:hypothetical protein [Zymomonas mobilis]
MPIMVPPLSRQKRITDMAFAMEQEESLFQQLRQTNQQIMTGLARDLLLN